MRDKYCLSIIEKVLLIPDPHILESSTGTFKLCY